MPLFRFILILVSPPLDVDLIQFLGYAFPITNRGAPSGKKKHTAYEPGKEGETRYNAQGDKRTIYQRKKQVKTFTTA